MKFRKKHTFIIISVITLFFIAASSTFLTGLKNQIRGTV